MHVMGRLLKPNLCDLHPSGWHKDPAQTLYRIQSEVSPCRAYVCIYWASHLGAVKAGAALNAKGKELLEHFAFRNRLEALSIVGMETAYES